MQLCAILKTLQYSLVYTNTGKLHICPQTPVVNRFARSTQSYSVADSNMTYNWQYFALVIEGMFKLYPWACNCRFLLSNLSSSFATHKPLEYLQYIVADPCVCVHVVLRTHQVCCPGVTQMSKV